MKDMKTVVLALVKLGPHEYGNERMRQAALEALRHPLLAGKKNVAVEVYEHAGWWLQFAPLGGELVVVGSANDRAEYGHLAREFRAAARNAVVEYVDLMHQEVPS